MPILTKSNVRRAIGLAAITSALTLAAATAPAAEPCAAKASRGAHAAQAGTPNGCHPASISGTFSGSQTADGGFSWNGTLQMTLYRDPKNGICIPPAMKATLSYACLPWDGQYRGTATFDWARGAPPAGCSYTQPTGTSTVDVNMTIGSGQGNLVFAQQDGWTYDGVGTTFDGPGNIVCQDRTSAAGDGIQSPFYASGNGTSITTRDMQTFSGTLDYGAGQRWSWELKGDSGTQNRKISKNGLLAIQQEEGLPGCKPKSRGAVCAYEDEFGYCTIGYGHLLGKHRCTAAENRMHWTRDKAVKQLPSDLDKRFEPKVRAVSVPLTQCQYDALVSFAYNVSDKSWKQLLPYLTAAKLADVPTRLGGFIGGHDSKKKKYQVSAALIGRRAREAAVFQHAACSCDGVVPRLALRTNRKTKQPELTATFFDDDSYMPAWLGNALDKLDKQH
jgi:GH24 family phage-related lysozyme (muramidase)